MIWFVVTSQGRIALGVFGAALESEAIECAGRVQFSREGASTLRLSGAARREQI